MADLFRNGRFYVLVFSILLSLGINGFIILTIPSGQLQIIRLTQWYGFISLAYLYAAILAGPLCYTFTIPFSKMYLHVRRAIGVSAFYFAMLHSLIAFFGQLDGFAGIGFLDTRYLIALGLSFIALIILMLLAMTSFDAVIKRITFPRWKILQRFVYMAGVLILVHMVLLGTHYSDLLSLVSKVTFVALAFLFILESFRLDAWFEKKFGIKPAFNYASVVMITVLFLGGLFLFAPLPNKEDLSLSVHSGHESTDTVNNSSTINNSPSMQGDRKLRYTVGFIKPDPIVVGQDTSLQFPIYNATNGNQVRVFQKLYEQEAHLIIVNNELTYFAHIHPERKENTFDFTTAFPAPGLYRLYLTYQPVGSIEQQTAFSVRVGLGDTEAVSFSEQKIDTNMTKVIDGYAVTLATGKPLSAQAMNAGQQTISFSFKKAGTKEDIKTLKPYLGAFGHLVMINQQTYAYLHIHPKAFGLVKPDDNGGPSVDFLPMPLQDSIKPGTYHMFGEFYPDGKRTVVEYTVEVGE